MWYIGEREIKFKDIVEYVMKPVGFLFTYLIVTTLFYTIIKDSVLATILSNVGFILFIYFYRNKLFLIRDRDVTHKKIKGDELFFVALLLFFIWYVSQVFGTYIYNEIGSEMFRQYSESAANPIFIILSLLIAPIIEELLYRKILYVNFKYIFGKRGANLCQALIFALSHMTLVHLPIGILSGVFLAMVYERTNDIKYPIIFHFMFNFLSMFMTNIMVVPFMYNMKVLVLLSVVLLAICLLMVDSDRIIEKK